MGHGELPHGSFGNANRGLGPFHLICLLLLPVLKRYF